MSELEEYKTNADKKKEVAEGFTQTMAQQEYLMGELSKGTAESSKEIVDYVTNSYKENGKTMQLSTYEQLEMLRQYVEEHKDSEDTAVKQRVASSKLQMKNLEQQLRDELNAISDNIPKNASTWETMCYAGLNAYKKNEKLFISAAFEQTKNAKKGVNSGTKETNAAWQALADKGYAVLDGNKWQYTDAGENYVIGLKNGINNKSGEVFGAVSNLGLTMVSQLKYALKEKSPSKAAFEAGDYFTIGALNGVEDKKKKLFSTITDMGKGMVERIQGTVTEMQQLQQGQIDADMTLLSNTRAVMDMEHVTQVDVYMDSEMIMQQVVKQVSREQTSLMKVRGKYAY